MTFTATVRLGGKTATGIPVPEDVVMSLGRGKRPPVRVTVNGYSYRTTIAPMGGEYFVPLSAEHRTKAGLAAGDDVDVDLEVDDAPREVTVPEDLAVALDAVPAAMRRFESLSYSNKSRYVLSVEGAKTTETRQRRIAKAVAELSGPTS